MADIKLNHSWRPATNDRRVSTACTLLTAIVASIAVAQAQLPATGAAEGHVEYPAAISAQTVLAAPAAASSEVVISTDTAMSALSARGVASSRSADRDLPETGLDVYYEAVTETEPFEHIEQQDPNRYADLPPRVVQAGVTGEVTRIYQYSEGEDAADGVPVLEVITAARQDEIVAIGTRERPAAGAAVDLGSDVWAALAQCESGGRANAVSGNGLYHGLFQFSVGTWRSLGGEGLPSEASPEEQLSRAQQLQARSGWGQWPACSKKLGLR